MLEARDRLIVALDVPTVEQAVELIHDLAGTVTFFKIGWELWMLGRWPELVREIEQSAQGAVFLDLKLPADIPTTIRKTVKVCAQYPSVQFLTLSSGIPLDTIRTAREARGAAPRPLLLTVPVLSSLDATDLAAVYNAQPSDWNEFIVKRAGDSLRAGCDGVIVSGKEIGLLRDRLPQGTPLVSPGIRPSGFASDDHKRATTPAEAIGLGASYLVVGRPICSQPSKDRRVGVAKEIIAEIEAAAGAKPRRAPGSLAAAAE